MKALLLPEQNGFRVLQWLGSLVIGLGALVLLAWAVLLVLRLVSPGEGMLLSPLLLSVLWLYALPLFVIGVLLRWAAATYRMLEENNRLLGRLLASGE